MKKKRSYAGENYWPGYVDALVNVVLNLVFMVAVFGIALVVFNSIPKSSRLATPEDHERAAERAAQRAAGVKFPTEGRLVDPLVNKAAEEAAAAAIASQASNATARASSNNEPSSLDPNAVLTDPTLLEGAWEMGEYDVVANGLEVPTATPPNPEVAQVESSKPSVLVSDQRGAQVASAEGVNEPPPSSLEPPPEPANQVAAAPVLKPDREPSETASAVGTSSNPEDAVGDDGLGAKTQDLVDDQISIIVADTYERKGGPNAQLSQRTDNSGRTIMTLDVPVESDPIMTFARPYLSAAFEATLPLESERFTVFTTTETKEPLRRRSAYLALSVIRNQLISTGVDPARIEMRMLDGALPSDVSIKFFVVASNDAPVARADEAAQQLEN